VEFPWILINRGEPLPELPRLKGASELSEIEEDNADDWIRASSGSKMTVETLRQANQYSMTLLRIDPEEDQDVDGVEDAYERFGR
jgi:hypothetical protein